MKLHAMGIGYRHDEKMCIRDRRRERNYSYIERKSF